MKKIMFFLMLFCIVSSSAMAATVAYWQFEEGPAGAQVPKTVAGYTFEPSVPDSSGNGNHLSVWDEGGAGYVFRSETAGQDSHFSVKNSGGFPAMWAGGGEPITSISPADFTIEATFKLENGGYRTIIGRDSEGSVTTGNLDLAALYFQAIPDNALAIKFCDVSGYWHEAISPINAFTSFNFPTDPDGNLAPWYSMAAVSDGSTLSLYLLEHGVDTEYQLIAQTDMTTSGSPDTTLTVGLGSGSDWVAGEWSVGRGLYNGGHGDRAWGYLDEIRISDTALTPSEFLMPAYYYDSPANNATLISVVRTEADNDLVFTIKASNIADVEVYLSPDDPNAADLIKTITSVGTGQQTVTLETELGSDLSYETDYYWKVIGYEPNTLIPANGNDVPVPGQVWSFTTAPEAPVITKNPSPAFIAVDAGEPNIVLTANGINGDFQWYKDGGPLSNGADFDGVTTKTLTIYDVQLADEGYYTFVVSSLVGDAVSEPARVMIHRQTSYYDFEGTSVVDGNDVFVDSIDGYPAVLMQESASAGLPTVDDVNQLNASMGNYLVLDNGDHATDPNGQYLQIYPGVVDYEDITISAWVHMKSYLGWSRVFDFGAASNGQATSMFFTPDNGSGSAIFTIRQQGVDEDSLTTHWFYTGQWYHVAVTLTGDTGRLYINGEYVTMNEGMTVDPIDLGATINYIGNSFFGNDAEFDGLIDDLKIWNYALSSDAVAQEYMDVTGDEYVCDTYNNSESNLWRYDQGWEVIPGDPSSWIGGNNNCKLDLADFAGLARRWLEEWQFENDGI